MPDDSGVADRPRGCWTSEVALIRKPERSCRGPVNLSPGILSSRIWTPDAGRFRSRRSSSGMLDLGGSFNKKTGTLLSGSGESISGDIQFSDMDALMPNASGVANQSPSEMPYLTGDFNKTTGMPLSGSGDLRRPMELSGCNALRGSVYNYQSREDLEIFVSGEFESIFVEIQEKDGNRGIIVCEIYHVPNISEITSINRYENITKKLSDMPQNVIIGTDQNFDYLMRRGTSLTL